MFALRLICDIILAILKNFALLVVAFQVWLYFYDQAMAYTKLAFSPLCSIPPIRSVSFCQSTVHGQSMSTAVAQRLSGWPSHNSSEPQAPSTSRSFDLTDLLVDFEGLVTAVASIDIDLESTVASRFIGVSQDLRRAGIQLHNLLSQSENVIDRIQIAEQHAQNALSVSNSFLCSYLSEMLYIPSCQINNASLVDPLDFLARTIQDGLHELRTIVEAITAVDREQLEVHFEALRNISASQGHSLLQVKTNVTAHLRTKLGGNKLKLARIDHTGVFLARLEDRRLQGIVFRMALEAQLVAVENLGQGALELVNRRKTTPLSPSETVEGLTKAVGRIYQHLEVIRALSSRRLLSLSD